MYRLVGVLVTPSIDYEANGYNARALKEASDVFVADWRELDSPQPLISTYAQIAANAMIRGSIRAKRIG